MSTAPRAPSSMPMHAHQLADLAARLAVYSEHAFDESSPLSASAVAEYCTASRERYRRWNWQLRQAADAETSMRPWLEEIFASEILTRVWAAMVYALASRREENWGAASVAIHAVRLHAAARHRAMRLLARCETVDQEDAADLDQLRRSMSRWIDLLVAHVQFGCEPIDVCEFAIDPLRARDFVDDLQQRADTGRPASLTLTSASLRAALGRQLQSPSPNGHLNHRLATSILSCVHSDVVGARGNLQDLWAVRLLHRATDAQRWVEQLLV